MKKQFIKEEIVNKLTGLISEIGEFNYNKTFTPNDIVAKIAREALDALSHISDDNTQSGTNEGSGKIKAKELASKKAQSVEQLKKMSNFFKQNEAKATQIKNKVGPKTPEENGIAQAWNLHGGDEGFKWCRSELEKFHDENMRTKSNLRKSGGAGERKGMGNLDKKLMKTNNHRIHR